MIDKIRYSDADLEEFKELIFEKLEKAKKDYEMLKGTITNSSGNDTEDTSPTFKILEEGAATLSKEEAGRLAQRQLKFIQHLQAALVRIENKTYGICRENGQLIPKERLRLVPHATLSIDAKLQQNKPKSSFPLKTEE
jgi:RNA polymerase-binding transcription factor DksA